VADIQKRKTITMDNGPWSSSLEPLMNAGVEEDSDKTTIDIV
jgi:hypothetical protein